MWNRTLVAAKRFRQPIEREVDYGRGVERQKLAEDQSADNGNTKRTPQFRAGAGSEGQRDATAHGRQGGHHDGPEAQQTRLVDRLEWLLAFTAFSVEREIDHHDRVLLHDAD